MPVSTRAIAAKKQGSSPDSTSNSRDQPPSEKVNKRGPSKSQDQRPVKKQKNTADKKTDILPAPPSVLLALPEELIEQIILRLFMMYPYYEVKEALTVFFVCKKLHRIAEPLIYKVCGYVYNCNGYWKLARTLAAKPELAKYIRRVDVRPVEMREDSYRSDESTAYSAYTEDFSMIRNHRWPSRDEYLLRQMNASSRAAEASVLLLSFPNLTSLSVKLYGNKQFWKRGRSSFYEALDFAIKNQQVWPHLREIELTWSEECGFDMFGTVLKTILKIPTLRSIKGAKFASNPHPQINDVKWPAEEWHGTSAVEHISLLQHNRYRGAPIDRDVYLACVIPRRLHGLALHWRYDNNNFINETQLVPKFVLQGDSLHRLELHTEPGLRRNVPVVPISSLKRLSELKTLVISAVLLTGNQAYGRRTQGQFRTDWQAQADIFPASLEELVITDEVFLPRFQFWLFALMARYRVLGSWNIRRIELPIKSMPDWFVHAIAQVWKDVPWMRVATGKDPNVVSEW